MELDTGFCEGDRKYSCPLTRVSVKRASTVACSRVGYPQTLFKRSGGGEGVLLEIIGGGVPPGSPNLDRPKKVIFHTRFQTWPLKSIPIFSPGL